jgi:NAD(P)-dependent dehydrogenase (short-subunit alcohol dehydrogenase family)
MIVQLEGKVALVTGGGSGIGRATALAFSECGAKVAIADNSPEAGSETEQLIQQSGGEALFVMTDVVAASQVKDLIDRIVATFGRLDCAHNNAGIVGKVANVADSSEENWDRVMSINLKGVWLCMKYEIQQMLRQGSGAIVNTASADALVGDPGVSAYCASKGGVVQLTRTAALEYAQSGIRINAVCPGTVRTPMIEHLFETYPGMEEPFRNAHPIGRFAEPEEIAHAVVWLCSDAASFMTGHPLVIDGGLVAQ